MVIELGTREDPYEVLELEEEEEVLIPVPPPYQGHHGDKSCWEGVDEELWDPAEILQVDPDEGSLPLPFQRGIPFGLNGEGMIIA